MKKLLVVLLFVPLVSFGQMDYYVSAKGGLNVREAPNTKAKKIATLLYGQKVTIESKTGVKLTINDTDKETGITKAIEGEWVGITSGEKIRGYVFDGLLEIIRIEKLPTILYQKFYDNGQLKIEGNYVSQKEGIDFLKSKKIPSSKVYRISNELNYNPLDGMNYKMGKWTYYYESGAIKTEEFYDLDYGENYSNFCGTCNLCLLSITNYSQNGNRINETDNFGKECGDYGSTFTTFYENGNIKSENEMNYESEGYVEYYINGQEKIEWFKGIETDESSCWDEDGNKIDCN